MKPFRWLDDNLTLDRVFKYIGLGYAVVGYYTFKGLRLKNKQEPIPYLSLGRTKTLTYRTEVVPYTRSNGKGDVHTISVPLVKLDNGRILESYYTEVALTEIDLEIVFRQYTFDSMTVEQAMVAQKDYLPEEYRKVIQMYYDNKTRLKGDESEEGSYMYTKAKNMLNAVYGMSATDPIHQEILYNGGNYTRSSYETMSAEEREKALKSTAFPYQWGVYTTAYARAQLQRAIDLCGDKIVYCDTDSVKTIGSVNLNSINRDQKRKAEQAKAYADDKNGQRHYIGLFEQDNVYDKHGFITQGAKRYAYIHKGEMGVTVSGVTKTKNEETGIPFAVEELGKLENFVPGMTWYKAGGTISVYNDNDDFDYTDPESGRTIHIGKNVAIVPSTYKLTYTDDYELLLGEIKLYGEYVSERE